ncbi:MAG: Ig-like domain-containing protein [bacterium]
MPSKRATHVLLLAMLLGSIAASADAILPTNDVDPFELPRALEAYTHVYDTSQHAPSREMAQRVSERLGGEWRVHTWNPLSHCPRRVWGTGIDLAPGGIQDAQQAEAVARAFVAANPDFFGGATNENLATYRVTNGMGKWAVLLQQTVRGIPVNEAFVTLALTESGRLYSFGANYYNGISVPQSGLMPRELAVQIARDAVPFDPASPMKCIEDETMILPHYDANSTGDGLSFPVTHMTEVTTSEPYGLYRTWVDAVSGEIVRRENQVTHAYAGQVLGDVEIPTYCDGNTPNTPHSGMNVAISGIGTATTDANGNFSIPGSGGSRSFTASFDGPFVDVNCNGCAGGDALFSGTIDEDVSESIYFGTTYRADERDVFYFLNATRNYINSIDPAWTYPKVTANVNINATCNANWGGTVLNFFRTGGGCHNTGEIGDVIAHEYGHCIQSSLLGGQGPNGQGEGNSDIAGTFMIDGSVIGIGFVNCASGLSCPGSGCRDCENSLQWPSDAVGQPIHNAGRVICGFNWDVRQAMEAKYGAAVGKEKTAQMWHFSRKMFGNPGYDQDDQAADYFVINDDDGDLTNGTPDYVEVCEGAMNHGFSCPTIVAGVFITHAPLLNTNDFSNPYPVVATIVSTEAALESDSLLVRYRVGGAGAYTSVQMAATGNPNEYAASIPAQNCGSAVDYFIVAEDIENNRKTSPVDAPVTTFLFNVANTIYSQNFETGSDWTIDPTNNCVTGTFVNVDPSGTAYQPEDDTTPPPGINALITAQNSGGSQFVDDVDGGMAATRSPILDLTGFASVKLTLRYFHGQSDTGDDPAGDFFRIQISNDGGATYPVDLVAIGDVSTAATWQTLSLDINSVITLTDQMRIRVQVSDGTFAGDTVEGGIDDIAITACPPAGPDNQAPIVNVLSPNGGEALVVGSVVPITWNATDNIGVTAVDILYSQNGGLSYLATIANDEPNNGSFSWDLTGIAPTNLARIRIVASDAALNAGEDGSDANFTIGPPPSAAPTVTLTDPNGFEVIDAQSAFPITWNAADDVGVTKIDLRLSLNAGADGYSTLIAENLPNTGTYNWSVNDVSTTQARIRVIAHDANFQTATDRSNSNFTIVLNVTGVPGESAIPEKAFIGANVPEPFGALTKIRFGIPKAGDVSLAVYSIEGRAIRQLLSSALPAGTFDAIWDGKDDAGSQVTSGRYFLRLNTPEKSLTKNITLMR